MIDPPQIEVFLSSTLWGWPGKVLVAQELPEQPFIYRPGARPNRIDIHRHLEMSRYPRIQQTIAWSGIESDYVVGMMLGEQSEIRDSSDVDYRTKLLTPAEQGGMKCGSKRCPLSAMATSRRRKSATVVIPVRSAIILGIANL